MTAPVALAALDNLAAHFSTVHRALPSMRVGDGEVLLVDSGLPCDTFNAACRARFAPGRAAAGVEAALEWFARSGHRFSWWVSPGDQPSDLGPVLTTAGLEPAETELAMAADLAGIPEDPPPEELAIARVTTAEDLATFARINAANWSPPDPLVMEFYRRAAPVLLAPGCPLRFYLGRAGGEPVATAEMTVAGGVVGLYNIATLAAHRRRGYGSALTAYPLLEARREGHRTAILQAASAGVGVYRRLGFRSFGGITEYQPPR